MSTTRIIPSAADKILLPFAAAFTRPTHTRVVWRWGRRWVVQAMAVKFPFASRPWALPVLMALYKPKELNQAEKHRHKTAIDLARQLVATRIHRFPDRRFIVLGDGGYASHEFAPPFARDAGQSVLSRGGPASAAAGENESERASERKGKKVAPTLRWRPKGNPDPALRPERIVGRFTSRWPIETTFQEMRTHPGFETTNQGTKKSVLRMAPRASRIVQRGLPDLRPAP